MSNYVPNDGIDNADENDTFEWYNGRQGTIYLIDAGKYMDNPKKGIVHDDEQFQLCLDCIEADLLKTILVNPKKLVSVVFYNTLHSPKPNAKFIDDDCVNTLVPKNCALFIPLKPVSKDLIQYFKNFKESENLFDFDNKFGSSVYSCFSEALWLCSRLVMQSNYKLGSSNIFLFTNNELPHPDESEEQRLAIERAKDLVENNITMELVPMVDTIDLEPFYKEFLSKILDVEEDEFKCYGPQEQRYRLLNRDQRENYKTSCLRHLNFELADGVTMACDIFSLSRTAKKPNSVKMFRSNKEVVVGRRYHYVEEKNYNVEEEDLNNGIEIVQRKVLPGELYKSQVICGEEIIFSPDEIIRMKSIQSPSLRLVGFKSMDKDSSMHPLMVKHCLFLYPNEKKTTGSTVLFRTLWQKCMDKQKYALCTLTMRRATLPKYVALVSTHIGDTHDYDGFYVIHLPTETVKQSAMSVLDTVVKPLPEPKPSQIDLLTKLCKKLRFKYDHNSFINPSLASFYTNLEALAYEEEVNEVNDLSLPDCKHQDNKIQNFLHEIEEEFEADQLAGGSLGKRNNAGYADGASSKAPKKDLTPTDIEQAIRNGRKEAVTVQHLKEFLRSKKVQAASSAKKDILFEMAQKQVN